MVPTDGGRLHRPPFNNALATGRILDLGQDWGDYYEVRCPECQGPQFMFAGTKDCTYCGSPMRLSHMHLVQRREPVKTPDTNDTNDT